MFDLIIALTVIHAMAKDLHYKVIGETFYGNHLLYDEIADGLEDYIDEIKENYYMCRDYDVPLARDIFAAAVEKMKDSTAENLRSEIKAAVYLIDQLATQKGEFSEGDITLLGDISKNLSKKLGFANNLLKQ